MSDGEDNVNLEAVINLESDVRQLKAMLRELCDALTRDPATHIDYNKIAEAWITDAKMKGGAV